MAIEFKVQGMRELKRKLAKVQTRMMTTLELHLNLHLNTLAANMRRRITDETGPNGELYEQAKEKVFGSSTPYEVTGSLVKNIQSVKLPSTPSDMQWSFGVQPIMEDTYSINLIFEMFRTGKRGLAKDVHKLSTEIAQELEDKYPNFKFFYKFMDKAKLQKELSEEVNEILTKVMTEIFDKK